MSVLLHGENNDLTQKSFSCGNHVLLAAILRVTLQLPSASCRAADPCQQDSSKADNRLCLKPACSATSHELTSAAPAPSGWIEHVAWRDPTALPLLERLPRLCWSLYGFAVAPVGRCVFVCPCNMLQSGVWSGSNFLASSPENKGKLASALALSLAVVCRLYSVLIESCLCFWSNDTFILTKLSRQPDRATSCLLHAQTAIWIKEVRFRC